MELFNAARSAVLGISEAVYQGSIVFRWSGRQLAMWKSKRAVNLSEKIDGYNEKRWKKSSRSSGDGASPHCRRLLFAGLAKYTPKYQRIRVYFNVSEVFLNFFTECKSTVQCNVGMVLRSD